MTPDPEMQFIQIAVAAGGNVLFALGTDGKVYQYDGSTKTWVPFTSAVRV